MSDQPEQGVEQQGAAQEAQPQSQEPKEPMYKIVVDGKDVEVPVSELTRGYQRQQDYTRKTQELAEARKKYNKEVEDKAVELYMKAMAEKQGQGQPAKPENDYGAKLSELEKKLQQAEAARSQFEANQFLDKMQSELSSKYGKMDWEKVLVRFHNGKANMDDSQDPREVFDRLAKESHEAALKYEQDIIDGYVKKKSASPHSKGELGGSTMPAAKGKGEAPVKTFEEARERAERRFSSPNS